jgi:hypothetical protein
MLIWAKADKLRPMFYHRPDLTYALKTSQTSYAYITHTCITAVSPLFSFAVKFKASFRN